MEIFGLIFLFVILVLIGVGLAVGLVACVLAAMLTLAGVFSVSAAIGVWRRNPLPALRAFVYQLSVLGGAVSGIVVAGVASALLDWDLPVTGLVVSGILGGAAAGLILALLTLWTTETAARLVGAQWRKHRQKTQELLPLP